jgi:hypothetical protein
MTLIVHPSHKINILLRGDDVDANQEERGLDISITKAVQKSRGGGSVSQGIYIYIYIYVSV